MVYDDFYDEEEWPYEDDWYDYDPYTNYWYEEDWDDDDYLGE